jgi:6-pyruvoyltetrahydropterin/6-carboxytetrahydropterin synthase
MYELKIVCHFSAAHRLKDFKGNCERLHGHNWKVEAYVTSPLLNEVGVVIDFQVIKQNTKEVLEGLDHRYLNETDAFASQNPSSENIASYIFDELSKRLNTRDIYVSKVTVWESEDACATYSQSRPAFTV